MPLASATYRTTTKIPEGRSLPGWVHRPRVHKDFGIVIIIDYIQDFIFHQRQFDRFSTDRYLYKLFSYHSRSLYLLSIYPLHHSQPTTVAPILPRSSGPPRNFSSLLPRQVAVSASRRGCRLSRLAPQQGCHARSSSSTAWMATSPASRARPRRSDYHSETRTALLQPRHLILALRHSFETEGSSPMWHGTCMGSQREPNPERQRYRAADRASRKCPQGLGTPYKAMGLGGMLWILPRVQGCKGGLLTQPHTGVNL